MDASNCILANKLTVSHSMSNEPHDFVVVNYDIGLAKLLCIKLRSGPVLVSEKRISPSRGGYDH